MGKPYIPQRIRQQVDFLVASRQQGLITVRPLVARLEVPFSFSMTNQVHFCHYLSQTFLINILPEKIIIVHSCFFEYVCREEKAALTVLPRRSPQ